nr:MAG TPA: hypothetical protein [Caudoviricetes sp.]DAW98196.1 MAG TPA: hypothetical protein [Bacteriophage sp.]
MPVILINKSDLRMYVSVVFCRLLVYNIVLYIDNWGIYYEYNTSCNNR